MKKLLNRKRAMSFLMAGCILLGTAGCSHADNEKKTSQTVSPDSSSLEAFTEETPTADSEPTGDTAVEDALSTTNQLRVIASQIKKWYGYEPTADYNYYYTVTDLDQNGRLEIISSSGPQGSGRFTYTDYFQVNEAGTSLKKCKTDGSLNDIVDNLSTAYYDKKKDEYHYITSDYASGGLATGYYTDISSFTLKNNRIASRTLAFYSKDIEKKKTTIKCCKITKSGKEKKITRAEFNREDIGDSAYADCVKMSSDISWFRLDLGPKKITEEQLLYHLGRSYGKFSLGYPMEQKKLDVHGYKIKVPQIASMEDQGKQMRLNRLIWDTVAENLDKCLYLTKDAKFNRTNPFHLNSFSGTVKYAGREKLSILITITGKRKGTADEAIWAYPINIDLVKEVTLSQEDIFPEQYRQKAEELIMEKACTDVKWNDRWGDYRKYRKQNKDKKLLDKKKDWEYVEVYQTGDSVGFIIPVPDEYGSYAIYEIPSEFYEESTITLENVDWEAYQYMMVSKKYQALQEYFPVLTGGTPFVWTESGNTSQEGNPAPKTNTVTIDAFRDTLQERFQKENEPENDFSRLLIDSISLCDLTGDGTQELILNLENRDGYRLILHKENGTFYGTNRIASQFDGLQENGIYINWGQDNDFLSSRYTNYIIYGEGNYYQMTFGKEGFGEKLIAKLEVKKDKMFYIDGKKVDKNTFDNWQDENTAEEAKEYVPFEKEQ